MDRSSPLILASASPRRRDILTLLDLPFEVEPAPGEPALDPALPPGQAALEVARAKAEQVAARHVGRLVLGADTVVTLDGLTLGKPADEAEAAAMLHRLSGRTHTVFTAVWLTGHTEAGAPVSDGFTADTDVSFYPLTEADITAYIATGEPMDKAGAYGIQGRGLRFIQSIYGDFYTVMGLPAAALYRFLQRFGNP